MPSCVKFLERTNYCRYYESTNEARAQDSATPINGAPAPMGDILNLNRHRKRIARSQAEQTAAVRRSEFGRTKVQRELEAARQRKQDDMLEGHRRIREDDT